MVREKEEALIDLLDRCEAKGLVIFQVLLGEDVYSFSHDLMQEALYDSIDPARRRRHHLQVGQAMEKLYTTILEERYDALAHHFLEGKDIGKAVEYSLKGGEKAFEASSWQRASDHFGTALELLEKLPEDLPRQAQLLQRVADLQTLLGRSVLRHSQEALDLHLRLGDRRKAARMHRLVAVAWISGQAGTVDMEKGLDQLEAAVKVLEAEPDSADKAVACSHLSHGLYHVLDLDRALQQGRHALRLAEQLNDPDSVTRAYTELAVVLAHRGELNQAQEYAERSWEVSLRSRDPEGKTRASMYPIVEWPWRNDRAWLEQWVGRFEEIRQRFHVVRYDSFMHSLSALLSALSGRPQEATEELRKAGEAFYQHPYLHPYVVHWTGVAHAVLGDWAEARRLLDESTDTSERGHHFHHNVDVWAHYGRFMLSSGNTSKAEDLLIKGYTLAHESGSALQELKLLPLLCELHVKMERLEQAEQDLKQAKELLAWPQPWRGLAAPVYLAEGLLTTARRHWPEAERAFSCAQNAERTHGFPYCKARVLVEWGEMHVRRDTPGDRERAKKLLDEALGIYQRCAAKKGCRKSSSSSGVSVGFG